MLAGSVLGMPRELLSHFVIFDEPDDIKRECGRVGDRRFRIVGVLAVSGQGLGMNTDELVFVPVSLAQAMFNSNTLFRIMVEANSREAIEAAKAEVADIIKQRHAGVAQPEDQHDPERERPRGGI